MDASRRWEDRPAYEPCGEHCSIEPGRVRLRGLATEPGTRRAGPCRRGCAGAGENPRRSITGARLLLALNDDAAAEALLVAKHSTLRGEAYYQLVPLAKAIEKKGRVLGTIVCYRALLVAILARASIRARCGVSPRAASPRRAGG